MSKWQKSLGAWLLPIFLVAFFVSLFLTNGSLGDFFKPTAWGSMLYANTWEHLVHGNLQIDPKFAGGEYFISGNGQFVTYFGIMPAFLRGLSSLLVPNLYAVNLTNLSMVLAVLMGLGSVWYAVVILSLGKRRLKVLGASIVLAILLASPMLYLLTWSWTYHEVILWGLAWALMFVSLYSIWVFEHNRFKRWHSALLGLAVGMAVLSRPTIGLTLILPYGYLIVTALYQHFQKHNKNFNLLLPGIVICALLSILTITVNYQRWGNPFTFIKIGQNFQFVELYPERRANIQKSGEFNILRLPYSLYYYLVPSLENVSSRYPFVTLDRELNVMNHAPHYDYIEGSRVPITLSMTYLLAIAVLGTIGFKRLRQTEKMPSLWLLAGTGLTALSLLTVYAVAVRYSAELLPPVVFMALAYIVTLRRGLAKWPRRKFKMILAVTLVVSLYLTAVTALAYKQFVWDVPASIRTKLQSIIHYQPSPNETKHIIDGKRFSIY